MSKEATKLKSTSLYCEHCDADGTGKNSTPFSLDNCNKNNYPNCRYKSNRKSNRKSIIKEVIEICLAEFKL